MMVTTLVLMELCDDVDVVVALVVEIVESDEGAVAVLVRTGFVPDVGDTNEDVDVPEGRDVKELPLAVGDRVVGNPGEADGVGRGMLEELMLLGEDDKELVREGRVEGEMVMLVTLGLGVCEV